MNIFDKCAVLTLEPFWKDVFKKCSLGKFPRGIRYDSARSTLLVPTPDGKRREVLEISDNPEECILQLTDIFRNRLRIRSPKDTKRGQDTYSELKNIMAPVIDCSWGEIKPRSYKKVLLMRYVAEVARKHTLTVAENRKMHASIDLAIKIKQLSDTDIIYNHGEIQDLKNTEFNEKTRTLHILSEIPPPGKRYSKSKKLFSSKVTKNFTKRNTVRMKDILP